MMNKLVNILIFIAILVPFTWSFNANHHVSKIQAIKENNAVAREEELQDSNNIHKNLKLDNNDNDDYDDQRTLFTAQQAKTNARIHKLLPIQVNQKSYDIDDDVDANTKYHPNMYKNLEAQPTGLSKEQQQKIHNHDVLKEKVEENEHHNTLQHKRHRRQLTDFLIAPNTRWCGRGNIANGTYNHLGGASMADKCCRTHDHCKLYIPAMSNRFELFNYRPYTLSHCNCDRRFRTCLKMSNDEDANTIGKLFFNLVQTQCFVLTKETICQQRSIDGTCLKEYSRQKGYLRNNKKY